MKTKLNTAHALLLAAGIVAALASPAISTPDTPPAGHTKVASPVTKAPSTASNGTDSVSKQVQESVDSTTDDKVSEIRDRAVVDAAVAMSEIEKALRSLDANDPQTAIDSIQTAIGKLQSVQAIRPDLALVPLGATVRTVDFITTKKEIEDQIDEVQRLLRHNQIQAAREAIGMLASETVITETELPLADFPEKLIEATKMIREEKNYQAKALITRTLSTVIVVDHVIPLPIVRAEAMLRDASHLAQKGDRTHDESARLDKLLDNAHEQIEIAEQLGYGSKKDFTSVYDQLDLIKEQAKNSEPTAGFFEKIGGDLKRMRTKIFK